MYDKINEYNAKQVVHVEPNASKAVRPTQLPYGPLPKWAIETAAEERCSVDVGAIWLCEYV